MSRSDRKLVILLIGAIAVLVVSIILLSYVMLFDSASNSSSVEYVPDTTVGNIQNVVETTISNVVNTTVADNSVNSDAVQNNQDNSNSQNTVDTNQTITNTDVSTMSEAEILDMLANAVNKTKAYTGNVSVAHTESFDANVTECTGGSLVASAANSIVGSILEPTDETLNFSGGTAVNSEGETVPLLLPQRNNFTLTMSGVKSISATASANETIVYVTLVEEHVGMTDAPTHNGAGVGYLDLSSLDLGAIEVTSADVVYTGSTITAHIDPNGYVSYVEYTIPMHVEVSVGAGFISGSVVFDGEQVEIWDVNW